MIPEQFLFFAHVQSGYGARRGPPLSVLLVITFKEEGTPLNFIIMTKVLSTKENMGYFCNN